jgi:hypothetical protein
VRVLLPLIARRSVLHTIYSFVCYLTLQLGPLHVLSLCACEQELALDVVLEEPLAAASASTLSVARYTHTAALTQ